MLARLVHLGESGFDLANRPSPRVTSSAPFPAIVGDIRDPAPRVATVVSRMVDLSVSPRQKERHGGKKAASTPRDATGRAPLGIASSEPPARKQGDLPEAALKFGPSATHEAPLPSRSVTADMADRWTSEGTYGWEAIPHGRRAVGIRGE